MTTIAEPIVDMVVDDDHWALRSLRHFDEFRSRLAREDLRPIEETEKLVEAVRRDELVVDMPSLQVDQPSSVELGDAQPRPDVRQRTRTARTLLRQEVDALLAAGQVAATPDCRRSRPADSGNNGMSMVIEADWDEVMPVIRAPLNAIVGYTDLMETQVAGPMTPMQRSYLARIKASSDHLIGLIDDILDLAKVELGRMVVERESIAAQESISAALALLEPQAISAGVDLATECLDASTFYLRDEDRVRQILVIPLSNALKFTQHGGSVTVRCGTSRTPDAGAKLTGDGPWTFIRVMNTGIGDSRFGYRARCRSRRVSNDDAPPSDRRCRLFWLVLKAKSRRVGE